ncbi:MAG: AAA family ATPase [Nitrospirae bacterium]|nr:AAA family ATPase [Nitrospirota bacterium]
MNDSIECLKCQISVQEKELEQIEKREIKRLEYTLSPKGFLSLKAIETKILDLYQKGYVRGESTGWPGLDKHYTVRPGEWTLITGIPSHGKTTFLDAMMVNIAEETGMMPTPWNFGIFSAENQPLERHAAGLIEQHIGKPFGTDRANRMSVAELKNAIEFLGRRFFFIKPPEQHQTVNDLLEIAKGLVQYEGMKAIVIDPWNELDHKRPEGLSETEYISQSLSKIRQFAREHEVHVWLVAHPTKLQKDKTGQYPIPTPYDVSGSAHWRNKADNCITVWRNIAEEYGNTKICIQKIRFKEVGRIGTHELYFDPSCGRYSEKPSY